MLANLTGPRVASEEGAGLYACPHRGAALNVSRQQIGRDLGGFAPMSKPDRPKGGRPKKVPGCTHAPALRT